MKQILVTLPLEERHRNYLEAQAAPADVRFSYRDADSVTAADLAEADAVLGDVDEDLLPAAEKLAWLQIPWAGADAFLRPGVLRPDTVLTNSSGAYGLTVSEHMLAVTLALVRRLNQYARNQAQRIWMPMGRILSIEGATVLVLGLGDIGGSYARKMKALGAYVIGVRRSAAEKPDYLDEQFTIESLDELLPRADIVAMVLPGGDATAHIMDERRLRLMKKGAYLINDGRGNAIDPQALLRVLEEGRLAGAAIDVTEPEPLPPDDPLWAQERLLITPHISGRFLLQETFERVVRIAGENLARYVRGEPLTHVVNRKVGY